MYRVIREINFSYAHRLMNYEGKCAHLHGHNGRVLIEVSAEKLNDADMVVDFHEIKQLMETWINEKLDHKTILSKKDPLVAKLQEAKQPLVLMDENPTAEVIARYIYEEARAKRLAVSRVSLWETPDSCAVYHE